MMLKRAQGRSEVPQIFVDNRPIGGWEALRDLEARGVLDRLLRLPSPESDALAQPPPTGLPARPCSCSTRLRSRG